MEHSSLSCAEGKTFFLLSHNLEREGSPLLLLETAEKLRQAGGKVLLANLAGGTGPENLAERYGIRLTAPAVFFAQASRADLVIANTAATKSWVARFLDEHPEAPRRMLWWIHELDADYFSPGMPRLDTMAAAVFDSEASLRNWQKKGVCLPEQTRVIHPGVKDSFLADAKRHAQPEARAAFRKKLGIQPGDFVLGLVGTYRPGKGQDLLVRTAEKIREQFPGLPLRVLLVGFHDERQRRKFLAGLDDTIARWLTPELAVTTVPDLHPYYAASDAFVMNSQDLGENFGRVTLEAMASGLPVLGTDGGGTPEIVVHGATGLLHPLGKHGQVHLAENILTLFHDRELARQFGAAGRKRVLDVFSENRFEGEFGALLDGILNAS